MPSKTTELLPAFGASGVESVDYSNCTVGFGDKGCTGALSGQAAYPMLGQVHSGTRKETPPKTL